MKFKFGIKSKLTTDQLTPFLNYRHWRCLKNSRVGIRFQS